MYDCEKGKRLPNDCPLEKPEYSDEIEYLRSELGLAMVINPEYAAAEEIARVLRFPTAIKIEPFAKGKVEIVKFKIPEGSLIIGISVKEMMIKYPSEIIVCTIERGDEAYIANGDFVFMEKDVVSHYRNAEKSQRILPQNPSQGPFHSRRDDCRRRRDYPLPLRLVG